MKGEFGGYAKNTSVPVERSRAEIEKTLVKYGATRFGTMSEPERVMIVFEVKGRQVQWTMPMPPKNKFRHERDHEAEMRRRWRVLVITVKALLEAVESRLLTFDQAFLPHLVIPGSAKTLGEAIIPRLDRMFDGGLRALLPENPE